MRTPLVARLTHWLPGSITVARFLSPPTPPSTHGLTGPNLGGCQAVEMRMHQMLPGLGAPATVVSLLARGPPTVGDTGPGPLRGLLQGSRDKGKLELHLSQTLRISHKPSRKDARTLIPGRLWALEAQACPDQPQSHRTWPSSPPLSLENRLCNSSNSTRDRVPPRPAHVPVLSRLVSPS